MNTADVQISETRAALKTLKALSQNLASIKIFEKY
jgi:hypothetical protein